MGGYDITCDPGDLYTRKCYVNVHSPSGCLASDPACTITQQEIISYTSGGDPISKAPSANRWQAWVPTLTTLDQAGIAYQPYGEAGLPFTATGIAGYSETPFTDDGSDSSDSTDSQVMSDSVSGGSAASKKGIPTWVGVIGAVGAIAGGVFGYKKWKVKQGTSVRSAEAEQSHLFGVDAVASDYWNCGKCRKTWDTKDDAEACCPTYSCPHCKEVVVHVEQHAVYRCPHCGDSLGEGYDWKAVNPAWVGDGVVKNAEDEDIDYWEIVECDEVDEACPCGEALEGQVGYQWKDAILCQPCHRHRLDPSHLDYEGFVAEGEDDKNVAYCINC